MVTEPCGCLVYPPGAPHENCDAPETTAILRDELTRIAKSPGGVLAQPCRECPEPNDDRCPCPDYEKWYKEETI